MTEFPAEEAAMPYDPDPGSEPESPIVAVKERHERRLMSIDGVQGVGVGAGEVGQDAIVIYLRDEACKKRVPSEIEGIPVRLEVTGEIEAY